MTIVYIDPNIRVRGNGTVVDISDVRGYAAVNGETVTVVEPESGLVGSGRITDVDVEKRLVYLSVDWASLVVDDSFSAGDQNAVCSLEASRRPVSPWFDCYQQLSAKQWYARVVYSRHDLQHVPRHRAFDVVWGSKPLRNGFEQRERKLVST